jgi:drug/metabolite transporter (DMT)-like permease
MKGNPLKVLLVYILICLIWGSTWLAIRVGLESLTPFISAGMRFVLASLLILLIMKFRKISLQLDRTSVVLYLLMGFFSFGVPFALVYWGEQYVPSGLAAVLFGVYPFFIALFSWIAIPSEEIGIWKMIGMIAGFAGIVIIFSDQFGGDLSSYLIGMAAVVTSGIIQAGMAVTIKKYGYHLNALSMNFIPMLIAGVFLILTGIAAEDLSSLVFDLNGILSIFYLALFGSVVTFTSYYWLLKRINIILLSLVAFITPVIALILGWLLYDEVLLSNHIAGSVMVLIGLLIANLSTFIKSKTIYPGQAVK